MTHLTSPKQSSRALNIGVKFINNFWITDFEREITITCACWTSSLMQLMERLL